MKSKALEKGCGCDEEIHKKVIICDKPAAPAPAPVVQAPAPAPVAPIAPAPVQQQCAQQPQANQMILVLPTPQQTCSTTTGPVPPVVTSTPPFNANIAPCDYHPDCCWWGSEVFPKSFWINQSYNAGRDYVLIGNANGNLQCDCDGKATVSNANPSQANWFIPEKVGGKIVALRSYYGGYLSIHADGSVDCVDHTICEENNFQVVWSSNTCAQDAPNYAALRVISGAYLSISNGAASSVQSIDATALFKGYLWDANTSACNIPPVTSTPPATPTPTTPTTNSQVCHEVEITVPERKHRRHKKVKKVVAAPEEDIITTTTVQHHKRVKKAKKAKKHYHKRHHEECDNDDNDSEYEIVDNSNKKNKKNKVASDDVYDSNNVYYINHDKTQTATEVQEGNKCDAKADDSKTYTIVDADKKDDTCKN